MMRTVLLLLSLITVHSAYAISQDPTRPPPAMMQQQRQAPSIKNWQVDAIIISDTRQVAIINGQTVKVGDEVAGNKVINISPNSVALVGPQGRITLFLVNSVIKHDSNR